MGVSRQITGMRGVYLVAAELSRRGFVVAPTCRGARGGDLLVTDEACQRAYAVQVKTQTGRAAYSLVGREATVHSSPSYMFVFVDVVPGATEGISFFVVPSQFVAAYTRVEESGGALWFNFGREETEKFRDRWGVFQAEQGVASA